MKKLIFVLAFFLIFCPQKLNALNDWTTPDEMEKFYSDESTELYVIVYFNGLGAGLVLGSDDDCVPDDIAFTGEEYYRMYRREYLRDKDLYDDLYDSFNAIPAVIVLQNAIQYEYPC